MTSNYSLYSIPAYWFLALVPHAYAVPIPSRSPPCNHDQLTRAPDDDAQARKQQLLEQRVPA